MASRKRFLAFDSSEDDTQPTTFTFKANENFAKFLVISSKEDKPITSLSPFIIEKQIESIIGTPKKMYSRAGPGLRIGQTYPLRDVRAG